MNSDTRGHFESQENKKLCFRTASLAQTRVQCEASRAKTKLFIFLRINMAPRDKGQWKQSKHEKYFETMGFSARYIFYLPIFSRYGKHFGVANYGSWIIIVPFVPGNAQVAFVLQHQFTAISRVIAYEKIRT